VSGEKLSFVPYSFLLLLPSTRSPWNPSHPYVRATPISVTIVLISSLSLLQVKLEPFLLIAKGSKGALTAKTIQNAISAVSSLSLRPFRRFTSRGTDLDLALLLSLSSLVFLSSPSCCPFLAFKRFASPSPPPPRPSFPFHRAHKLTRPLVFTSL